MWYRYKGRHRDTLHRIESRNKPMHLEPIDFWHGCQDHSTGNIVFNEWYLGNWVSTYKRIKMNPYLTLYTRDDSKRIKDLSVRAKTIELWEENTGINQKYSMVSATLGARARRAPRRKRDARFTFQRLGQNSWPAPTRTASPEGKRRGPHGMQANHTGSFGRHQSSPSSRMCRRRAPQKILLVTGNW